MNKRVPRTSDEEWQQIIIVARTSYLSDFEYCRNSFHDTPVGAEASTIIYSLAQTAKLNNLSVFKYLQAVLLYMLDYIHEPDGIEELMPWSDKIKKTCTIDTKLSKARMENQRSYDSKLVRSANTERLC